MLFTGVAANAAAVFIGGLLGLLLKRGLPARVIDTVMQGLGLCILYLGIDGALVENDIIIAVLSIVIGGALGALLDIDLCITALGDALKRKLQPTQSGSAFTEGFLNATVFTCIGAVAILGALQSGLLGLHDTYYFKAIVDAIFVLIMASTFGIGVCFAAFPLLLYQGALTLGAHAISALLLPPVVNSIACVGSLLIIGLGLNLLKITNIKVANLLPAPFIPILLHLFLV